MIDWRDPFGRGEIKRLSFELRDRQNKLLEAEHEIAYLRGMRTAQGAAIEAVQDRLRAEEALNRQLQHENKQLWNMYRESERVRQKLAGERGGEDLVKTTTPALRATSPYTGEAGTSSVACGDSFPLGGSL